MDDAFLQKYEIDYLAHDEEVYPSAGHDDVYQYVKSQGMRLIFVPSIHSFFLLTRSIQENSSLLGEPQTFPPRICWNASFLDIENAILTRNSPKWDMLSSVRKEATMMIIFVVPTVAKVEAPVSFSRLEAKLNNGKN